MPYLHTLNIILMLCSLRKTVGKVSPILVMVTSRRNSDLETSNVSLKENKPDGVDLNSNDIDYHVRKNEGKILWFSADGMMKVASLSAFELRYDSRPTFANEAISG